MHPPELNNQSSHTFAEFFAGIGLMRIGLERAGWRIAFANDIDECKWRMYRDNFGDTGEFLVGDVRQLHMTKMPSVALSTPRARSSKRLWTTTNK